LAPHSSTATMYRRDEDAIAAVKRVIHDKV
jgi:hypothetical protein